MRPAELLRAVTAALTSPDEETAFARLPGTLKRSLNGHKKVTWDGSDLSIPVAGVGALLVPTSPPDDDLMAAAESVGVQIAQFVERCRAERAMLDFEARRAAMLDVAFDSVFTMDDAGTVLSANRAAERTFGYAAAEIVGQELAALIIPDVAARRAPGRARAVPEDRARADRRAARGAHGDAPRRHRVPGRARGDAAQRPRRARVLRLSA